LRVAAAAISHGLCRFVYMLRRVLGLSSSFFSGQVMWFSSFLGDLLFMILRSTQ
jgi:hypothetical protein